MKREHNRKLPKDLSADGLLTADELAEVTIAISAVTLQHGLEAKRLGNTMVGHAHAAKTKLLESALRKIKKSS